MVSAMNLKLPYVYMKLKVKLYLWILLMPELLIEKALLLSLHARECLL